MHLVGLTRIVLVDQIEGVPAEVNTFAVRFNFPKGGECLISKFVHVNIYSVVHTLFLHVVSAVAMESDVLTTNGLQFFHHFRSDEVGPSRICEDANGLLGGEVSVRKSEHFNNYYY